MRRPPDGGHFVARSGIHLRARNGRFTGSFPVSSRGVYAIRAYYSGQKGAKRYLRVS
jgi:hypothetical protein